MRSRATPYHEVGSTRAPASRTSVATHELVHRFQTNRPYLASVLSPRQRSPPSPHPAQPSASSPVPGGEGSAWGYPVASRARKRYRRRFPERIDRGEPPRNWFLAGIPRAVDRGDIAIGGGGRGGGIPPPHRQVPISFSPASPQVGTRAFLPKAPAPPSGGEDGAWGYPGKSVPGDANSRAVRSTTDDILR